jgi:hypothetical protein
MVEDEFAHGAPGAWWFTQRENEEALSFALTAVTAAVRSIAGGEDWQPVCALTDDSKAEQNALRWEHATLSPIYKNLADVPTFIVRTRIFIDIPGFGILCRAVFGAGLRIFLCIFHVLQAVLDHCIRAVSLFDHNFLINPRICGHQSDATSKPPWCICRIVAPSRS